MYVFTVAAGILPAVEPGILPGGNGVWCGKATAIWHRRPGGKMPPSTAAKMAAATNLLPTVNTYLRIGARDSSRRNLRTAQMRLKTFHASFADEQACALTSTSVRAPRISRPPLWIAPPTAGAIQSSARYRDTCRPGKRQIRGTTGQFREGNRVGTTVAKMNLQDERRGRGRGATVWRGSARGIGSSSCHAGSTSVNGAVDR